MIVDDLFINHYDQGKSDILLFLPCWSSNHIVFGELFRALGQKIRVMAMNIFLDAAGVKQKFNASDSTKLARGFL